MKCRQIGTTSECPFKMDFLMGGTVVVRKKLQWEKTFRYWYGICPEDGTECASWISNSGTCLSYSRFG